MRKTKSPKIKMVSKALAERIDKQCKQYKAERDKLETQKTALARSYKQVVEENEKLKEENEELREQILGTTEYMEED